MGNPPNLEIWNLIARCPNFSINAAVRIKTIYKPPIYILYATARAPTPADADPNGIRQAPSYKCTTCSSEVSPNRINNSPMAHPLATTIANNAIDGPSGGDGDTLCIREI